MTLGRVFISYRAGTDSAAADALEAALGARIGPDRIVRDIDEVPPGVDYAQHIDANIRQCSVLLAVIGPGWLEKFDNLQRPDDFPATQIEAALERDDVAVIPVLLDGARMPKARTLPEPIAELADLKPIRLSRQRFERDVKRIINRLEAPERRRISWRWAGAPAAIAMVLGFGYLAWEALDIESLREAAEAEAEQRAAEADAEADRYTKANPNEGLAGGAPELRAPLPEEPGEDFTAFRECETCPAMVILPGGKFRMGAPPGEPDRKPEEGPVRMVEIERFAIGRTEVTFDDWAACVWEAGCRSNPVPADRDWGRRKRPVIMVSWHEAQEYIDWLNTKVPDGDPYRLPSEAEWEYAARAGTQTAFAFGDEIGPEQANFGVNALNRAGGAAAPQQAKTVPVTELAAANSWSLRHMHGNVWEWVSDCWHSNYEGAPSEGTPWGPEGGGDCTRRVVRGGSFTDTASVLRSARRAPNNAYARFDNIGFRVARDLPADEPLER